MKANVILHPTDGSEAAAKALDYAIDLALASRAKLVLLHVQRKHGREIVSEALEELERVEHITVTEADVLREAANATAERAADMARDRGVSEVESIVVEGDPTSKIVAFAEARKADMIVMGSRGLGDLQGLLLGSVSHKVAQVAPCTCIIVR